MKRLGLGVLLSVWFVTVWAHTFVENIRVLSEPSNTKVVFEFSEQADYHLFALHNPERLVIDLKNGDLSKNYKMPDLSGTPIHNIRTSNTARNQLRVVLDLVEPLFHEASTGSLGQHHKQQLVLELSKKAVSESVDKKVNTYPVSSPGSSPGSSKYDRRHPFIVVIDAGHGGADPGAVGKKGTREKDVVLSIAKKLQQLINQTPGMKAVMTREGDHYIGLRQRVVHARSHKADLFISIHADSYHNTAAYGASVYMLSQRGASSTAARWIAERENRADLVGGVRLNDKDATLASVLLDLSQAASGAASLELGQAVLKELDKSVATHKKHVESAGFAVLKAPDIPSILVESGFLSNPLGEQRLRTADYQWNVAHSIMKGIHHYRNRRAPIELASAQAIES